MFTLYHDLTGCASVNKLDKLLQLLVAMYVEYISHLGLLFWMPMGKLNSN